MKINRSKKKLKLRVEIRDLGSTLPVTSIPDLISWLENIQKDSIENGYSNLSLEFDWGGWDDPYDLRIYGTREETDKEYANRQKLIKKEKRSEKVKMEEHIKHIKAEAEKLGLIK